MNSTPQVSEPTLDVHIVNAFVKDGQGGNPAGVVVDADSLSEVQMQKIAAAAGLSETAFVSRSATEGAKLDFFTPTRRIAHCGHATIATFALLNELGRVRDGVTSKETVDGPRRIIVAAGEVFMQQLAPRYESLPRLEERGVDLSRILGSLGLQREDLDTRFAPHLVNTGNSFIVIGVRSGSVLEDMVPDQSAIASISEELDLIGYYVFTTDREATTADATTRMFAPRFGIPEESATGMAAGPLACVLYDFLSVTKENLAIEQGAFMKPASPSAITVRLSIGEGRISGLMAGGRAKVAKTLTVPV
ncbi:PhzF family phenazine biosynthesis protein [Ensifer sp. ENS04]|nr:PhzF family phenazine biosynthesis protein [Ensifer sp. ENS04]